MTTVLAITFLLAILMAVVCYQKVSEFKSIAAATAIIFFILIGSVLLSYTLAIDVNKSFDNLSTHAMVYLCPVALGLFSISSLILPMIWKNEINLPTFEFKYQTARFIMEIVSFIGAILQIIGIINNNVFR